MSDQPDLPQLRLDPIAILRALEAHRVSYVLIGGYALILQGLDSRVTYDLDVVPADDNENLTRLGAALAELDARVITHWDPDRDELHVDVSDFAPHVFLDNPFLHLVTRVGRIDVLMNPAGLDAGYADLSSDADEEIIRGVAVQLASVAELIVMKEAAGRPRDLTDLHELYRIRDEFTE